MTVDNWTLTTDDEELFEFENDDYPGLMVRGDDREFSDQKTPAYGVTVMYRSQTLLTICTGKATRDGALDEAEAWMADHPGLAGIRVNDGVKSEIVTGHEDACMRTATEWSSTEREMAKGDLEGWGLGEGEVYFDVEKNSYYEVTELTVNGFVAVPYHEKVRKVDGVYSTTLADISKRMEQTTVEPVSETVETSPVATLLRYAEKEISKDLEELGPHEPVEGIDGVETVSDVRDSLFLSRSKLEG